MDPAAPLIKKMTQIIEKNVQEMESNLSKKYGTIIERIESKRFNEFQKCLKQTNEISKCYGQVQKYHVTVDFDKANKQFQDCVHTIPLEYFDPKIKKDHNFVEGKVKACTLKYESIVAAGMKNEIKRLNTYFDSKFPLVL